MGIWKEHFYPNVLLRWEVVSWIIGALLAVGAIVLIFDQYLIGNLCFITVAIFLCAKIIHSAIVSKGKMISSVVFAFVLCGIVGAGITAAVRGVNAYRDKKGKAESSTQENGRGRLSSNNSQSPRENAANIPRASTATNKQVTSNRRTLGDPISSLSQLGWTVKRDPGLLTFEVVSRPLPSMRESEDHFGQLREPFRLRLQSVPNLDGLERLWSIDECREIELSASDLSSISQLAGFKSLRKLTVSQVPLNTRADIDSAPLAGLVKLTSLTLNYSRVSDLSPITKMPGLTSLIVERTLVRDSSPIRSLQDLKILDLRDSNITDLSPVANCNKLEELTIDTSQVGGLEYLSSLPNLQKLVVIGQTQTDLSPIGNLTHLKSLFIWGLPLMNLGFLRRLPNLTDLQVSGFGAPVGPRSKVTDSNAICAGHNLKTLTLGALEIPSLAFAPQCEALAEINLRDIPITSLNDLATVQTLKKISLVDVPVVEISPLLALPNLESVSLIRVPARADVVAALERKGIKVENP